ncbi:MAG TPA: SseB family protein [Arthrobacter sp.]|nr:SseB family protein [Arthrobacter sp.]
MPEGKLPPHIAQALAGAGGVTDSANRPWSGRNLGPERETVHRYEDDDGRADEGYRKALDELNSGTGTEAGVVAALAAVRLFVPIVAEVAATGEGADGLVTDKESDMAMVSLKAPDGRKALPVFSSVEFLQAWHPEARPVAVAAPRAALSAAAEDAQLMVIDPGAAQTFVVRRPAAWSLAQQKTWTPSYLDDEVRHAVALAAEGVPAVHSVQIRPGSGVASLLSDGRRVDGGGPGPELRLIVGLIPGLAEADVKEVVGELQTRLAANKEFVERVDSLEVKLASAG